VLSTAIEVQLLVVDPPEVVAVHFMNGSVDSEIGSLLNKYPTGISSSSSTLAQDKEPLLVHW